MSDQGFGAGPIRPGHELDWESLADYLRNNLDVQGSMVVAEFERGSSTLNYLVGFEDSWLVVRRHIVGHSASPFSDLAREYRITSQLWRAYPRAPRGRLLCSDPTVIGSEFLVHDLRRGEVIWRGIPASFAGQADPGRRIGMAVVDALADLHLVDPDECGLSDVSSVEAFIPRTIEQWRARWADIADRDLDPLMQDLADRLAATAPIRSRRSIVHLDFRLNNCQFAPGEPDRVTSLFDWDRATLGDPLIDLGILLNHWPDPSDTPHDRAMAPASHHELGLPTREDMVARYCLRTDVDPAEVAWYEAFGAWQVAVMRQVDHRQHFRAADDDHNTPQSIDVPIMIGRARRLLVGAKG